MTAPEQALEQARAAVASMRAAGEYPVAETLIPPLAEERVTYRELLEWSLVEPDLDHVRSTRRWGAPITGVKRLLLRLLYQYHSQLVAEQARFNMNLVRYVQSLEERVAALERTASAEQERGR